MGSSGEYLAPVAYLFGSGPGGEADSSEESLPRSLHAADPTPESTLEGEPPPGSSRSAGERASRRAENVSLSGLTRRNMSRWEIEKLLLSRDIHEDTIAAEIERLERVGLIDDAALAETLVRTQRERKKLGHQALVAELRRRHIDQAIIDAALDGGDDDEGDEQRRATELAVKRAGQLSSYDVETAKRRLTAFLMRKGYSSSIVRAAVSEALGGRSSGVRFR